MSADNYTKCPRCGQDLREDYDIGIIDGAFEIDFRASCIGAGNLGRNGRVGEFAPCGFRFQHKHSEEIAK